MLCSPLYDSCVTAWPNFKPTIAWENMQKKGGNGQYVPINCSSPGNTIARADELCRKTPIVKPDRPRGEHQLKVGAANTSCKSKTVSFLCVAKPICPRHSTVMGQFRSAACTENPLRETWASSHLTWIIVAADYIRQMLEDICHLDSRLVDSGWHELCPCMSQKQTKSQSHSKVWGSTDNVAPLA